MAIVLIGIGFMILISGRPAYFVFTGGMAFLLGTYVSNQFPMAPGMWNSLLVPAVFAVIGVMLAFAFKRWAARVAGFAAAGYLVYNLPGVFGAQNNWANPVTFAIAGALSFVLLIVVFDAYLVFLSALTAVTMILNETRLGSLEPVILFLILLIFSIISQYLIYEYGKPSPD